MHPSSFVVFGATGGTGQHFVELALTAGHEVRALVRDPSKLAMRHPKLHVQQGSILDTSGLDDLLQGTGYVVCMVGDRVAQQTTRICEAFVKSLIPAMRRQGAKRLLYQAGGLSTPYKGHLSPVLWTLRHTLARGFDGQHKDNEAVMRFLAEEALDMEWIVHRASIHGNGPSKGVLTRSSLKLSISTHRDCAAYNLRTVMDTSAIHTSDFSCYTRE